MTPKNAPGPEQRHVHVQSALMDLGYGEDLLRAEFPVVTRDGISRCDYAAFGQAVPRDMTTATLVADVVPTEGHADGLVARALAAPFRLAAAPTTLEIWNVSSDGGNDGVVERLDYGSGGVEWPGRLVTALGPEPLLKAKRGGRQLSLLEIDVSLLPTAQGQITATLSERVEDALDELLTRRVNGRRLNLAVAARLVVGALTALMVRDKTIDAGEHVVASAGVLSAASTRFPTQFAWAQGLDQAEQAAVEALVDSLGADVNYASLDPAVVSSVYEGAVVSKAAREHLGVHYTPFDLARRIAAALPFEKLEPDARSVLDLACGSGTLLLAAHDRLQALAPRDLEPVARHEYVRAHLTGFDLDEFAVQIARLSLLLHALPEGDGWNIEARDALEASSDGADERFSVVMTNPPWRQRRSVNKRRHERADDFVMAALKLTAPGGLLALILPATWLDSDASRDARTALTDQADVFEVWRLPEQTFGSASLAPCVVLAEREAARTRHTLFRRALPRGEWRDRFLLDARADEQHLAKKPVEGRGFLSGPLGRGTGLDSSALALEKVALIQQGPVPKPPIDEVGAGGGDHRWLRGAEAMPAYGAPPEEATIAVRYPEDFHRRIRDPSIFDAQKLLISSKRSTNNPWRVKVGFDLSGLIPRETLYMVVPRKRDDEELLWGLFAVLSSSTAACWVDTYSPTLSIPRRVITSMPVPSGQVIRTLATYGSALADAAGRGAVGRDVVLRLEEAVWNAYELDDAVRARVRSQLAGFRAPEGSVRFDIGPEDSVGETAARGGSRTRRFGATLDSDETHGVKLWVPGLTEPEGEWHPVPERFLGWLTAQDATFDVRVNGTDLHHAMYAFQANTYRSHEDIAAELNASARDEPSA